MGVSNALAMASCLGSAVLGPLRGPLDPWQWAEMADDVAVVSIAIEGNRRAQPERIWLWKGGDGFVTSQAFQKRLEPLSIGYVEAWGAPMMSGELPRLYLIFAGSKVPYGCQAVPIASSDAAPELLSSPNALPVDLNGRIRAVLLATVDDPSDEIAVSAAEVLLRWPTQPDREIEAALERLGSRADPNARLLTLCSRILHGEPEWIPEAVRVAAEPREGHSAVAWACDSRLSDAIRSSSQCAAIPHLLNLLADDQTTKLRPDVISALGASALPDVVPALVEQMKSEEAGVRYHAVGALSGLTLKHSWHTVVYAPEEQKQQVRERWRAWWQEEGAPLFERQPPPARRQAGEAGVAERLLFSEVDLPPETLAEEPVEAIARALAAEKRILVAINTALDTERRLLPEAAEQISTVRDLAEALATAVESEAHVWERGIAFSVPRFPAMGPREAARRAQIISEFLAGLSPEQIGALREHALIPAATVPDALWERVRTVGQGELPPIVEGTSLLDLPRESLWVAVQWGIRFDVWSDGDAKPFRLDFSHTELKAAFGSWPRFLAADPTQPALLPWPARRSQNLGQTLSRVRLTDHRTPYWQMRFAAEAASQAVGTPPPPPEGPLVALPEEPVLVLDAVQLIAAQDQEAKLDVDADLAMEQVLLLGPAAAARTANVKLAVAEAVGGEWRRTEGGEQLTAMDWSAVGGRRWQSDVRLWAPTLAEFCRQLDPTTYTVWQGYVAALARGTDAGRLPLALQQPLRLGLQQSEDEAYRAEFWKPWNDGSVHVMPHLVTELFIVRPKEAPAGSPAWGATWPDAGFADCPVDLRGGGA